MNRLVIRKPVYNEIMALLEKSMRDCSKLIPKMIIDKNGHARKVYVKLGLPVKPAEGGKVENRQFRYSTMGSMSLPAPEAVILGKFRLK